jgi:hypothetical protein
VSEKASRGLPQKACERRQKESEYGNSGVEDVMLGCKAPLASDKVDDNHAKDGAGILIGFIGGGFLVFVIVWLTTRGYR